MMPGASKGHCPWNPSEKTMFLRITSKTQIREGARSLLTDTAIHKISLA